MQNKGLTSRLVLGAIKNRNIVDLFLFLLIGLGIVGLVTMNKDEFLSMIEEQISTRALDEEK